MNAVAIDPPSAPAPDAAIAIPNVFGPPASVVFTKAGNSWM